MTSLVKSFVVVAAGFICNASAYGQPPPGPGSWSVDSPAATVPNTASVAAGGNAPSIVPIGGYLARLYEKNPLGGTITHDVSGQAFNSQWSCTFTLTPPVSFEVALFW